MSKWVGFHLLIECGDFNVRINSSQLTIKKDKKGKMVNGGTGGFHEARVHI